MDFCSQLSLNLLIDSLKNVGETNLVFSPLSYNIVLNMTAGAASGSTLKEMLNSLQCQKLEDVNSNSKKMMCFASDGGSSENDDCGGGPVIQCLNGIWLDQRYRLKSSYQDLARIIYNAPVKIADFEKKADEVVEDANAWAKASTKGLISEVLRHGDLDKATMVLGNALYFKGFWEDCFDPTNTTNKPFYLMNGKTKPVPFMIGCEIYFYRSFNGFEVVSIPYQKGENSEKGDMFSMYIFLPKDRFGLEKLLHEAASDSGFLRQDFKLYKSYGRFDYFWIPKFKFSYYTSKGVETMQKMGLKSPFDENSSELTEMVDGSISVSKVIQKSFIEVNEKGTDAAAITMYYHCQDSSGGPPRAPTEFIADHPFMFMIREEKSKSVLFVGVVLDPTLV